jgi:multisubunit Na+/H+ antiporter MnhB subunit
MLSALSKLLATLLVTMLTGTILTTVVNQTVLSSHYVEGKLTETNSYQRLSVALSDQVGQKVTAGAGSENQLVTTKLQTIITPDVLKVKINTALEQMQAYLQGSGPRPTIDLTDLGTQAQAAGIPVPADSGLAKPISFPNTYRADGQKHNVYNTQQGMIIASAILAVALVAVCWRRQKWVALPDVLIWLGALVGFVALVLAVTSNGLAHHLNLGNDAGAFTPIGRDVAATIMNDLAKRLGLIAVMSGVAGIAGRIAVDRLKPGAMTPQTDLRPISQSRSATSVKRS